VDTGQERPRWRFTANYRVHPRVQIGVEYNPLVDEVDPLATVFLLTEDHRRPAFFLGTSSDRIGSPKGTQSYYLTASKVLPRVPLSAYGSLNYSEWDDGFNVPFGAEWFIWRGFSARYMYDGERSHLMGNWFGDNFGISLIAVWMDTFGIAVAGGF